MSNDFSVESARFFPKLPVVKPSGVEREIYGPSEFGVLTREDKRMLEEYSGYEFDFPPGPGQPFPRELAYVAQARGREYREGAEFSELSSLLGQIQRTYRMMSGQNVISADFMAYVGDHTRAGGGSWAGYDA